MNNQNFQGQDLRGRSFAGQTLSDVDFSDCDLRGVDFSGTKLTRVKFCRARMGRTWKAESAVWLLQSVLGGLSWLLIVGVMSMLHSTLYYGLDLIKYNYFNVFFSMSLFFIGVILLTSVQRRGWHYVFWLIGVCLVVGVLLVLLAAGNESATTLIFIIAVILTFTAIASLIMGFIFSGVVVVEIMIIVVIFSVALSFLVGSFSVIGYLGITSVGMRAGVWFILIGIYFGCRSVSKEELNLIYMRRLYVKIKSLFCTNFSSVELNRVDFDGVDLRGVRFSNAQLAHCSFKKTKNHHLALTINSSLEPRKVRELIINGMAIEKDFQNLNLQGLDFSGLDLRGFNFSNSNISFANFGNCDLRDANLSEATALGTNFNHAKFTGACIKNWNIDKRTELQSVNCDFVYLDGGQKQRNPPEGDFAADEFSKLYQQVADTVDFIANNHEELDALIQAIKKIKENSGGADIFVQNIERKEDSVIVKVKAPPEFSKEEVYKEVRKEQKKEIKRIKQEYEKKLLQAKSEVEVVLGQKNLLADVLKNWLDRPTTVTNINQLESIGMKTDNSRHFNGSHNENVNLGDVTDSTVTQQINQNQPPAAENVELKNLLNEFQALIAKLPAHEQKEAQDEAKKLEEAANKPKEEQESTVRKTLRYFKGLAVDLGDLPEIGTQFGEVIAKIGLQFE